MVTSKGKIEFTGSQINTTSTPVQTIDNNSNKCQNCGQLNNPEYKFCLNCGSALFSKDSKKEIEKEQEEKQTTCQNCGNEIFKGALFCISCGTKLTKTKKTKPKEEAKKSPKKKPAETKQKLKKQEKTAQTQETKKTDQNKQTNNINQKEQTKQQPQIVQAKQENNQQQQYQQMPQSPQVQQNIQPLGRQLYIQCQSDWTQENLMLYIKSFCQAYAGGLSIVDMGPNMIQASHDFGGIAGEYKAIIRIDIYPNGNKIVVVDHLEGRMMRKKYVEIYWNNLHQGLTKLFTMPFSNIQP
jgi:uncharacterized Zn finger protein (UPF0148 family)